MFKEEVATRKWGRFYRILKSAYGNICPKEQRKYLLCLYWNEKNLELKNTREVNEQEKGCQFGAAYMTSFSYHMPFILLLFGFPVTQMFSRN